MTLVRVVDDDRVIAELLRGLLEHDGFDVAVTDRDFAVLLSPTLWEQVSVAIIDLHLRDDVTGIDILEYLTENHPRIRRIVLTAAIDTLRLEDGLGKYADAVLPKPTDFHDIVKAVRGE